MIHMCVFVSHTDLMINLEKIYTNDVQLMCKKHLSKLVVINS
jgi:hypothetical protein